MAVWFPESSYKDAELARMRHRVFDEMRYGRRPEAQLAFPFAEAFERKPVQRFMELSDRIQSLAAGGD